MNKNNKDEKMQHYLSLLNKSYDDAIIVLQKKYGNVYDDFFREKSYIRFLNGEIKSITKEKYGRGNEGLYTHHIDEKKHANLQNLNYISHFKYSFDYQRKNRLVYCDLFEHIILHALIFVETDGHYGGNGYDYLRNMALQWFTTSMIPKPEWMKKTYSRAFLTSKQTKHLFSEIEKNKMQGIKAKGNPEDDKIFQEAADRIIAELSVANYVPTQEEKEKKWNSKHPLLVKNGINFKTPRKKLLKLMYKTKFQEDYDNLEKFVDSQLNIFKDQLENEFEDILKEQQKHSI